MIASLLLVLLQVPLAEPASAALTIEPLPKAVAELASRFTPEQIEILEKLNRRDREHFVRTDPPVPGLVVPSVWDTDPLAYSPYPLEWAATAAIPKYIVVHQPGQSFGAYEFGRLVRWGPVSTGPCEVIRMPGGSAPAPVVAPEERPSQPSVETPPAAVEAVPPDGSPAQECKEVGPPNG